MGFVFFSTSVNNVVWLEQITKIPPKTSYFAHITRGVQNQVDVAFHGNANADAQPNQRLRIVVTSKAVQADIFKNCLRQTHDMVKSVVNVILAELGVADARRLANRTRMDHFSIRLDGTMDVLDMANDGEQSDTVESDGTVEDEDGEGEGGEEDVEEPQ